jgi:5-oxoprolinase (ATP-hydrolysing) subunit A
VQSVDLNADLGEMTGEERWDELVLDVVTSASVACGFHAGNPEVMHHTIRQASRRGVTIGAHPSYADRDGFGRVEQDVPPDRLTHDLLYQIGALEAFARACGTHVRYVKPHGALYHRMAVDEECAEAVCDALDAHGGLALLAPSASVAVDVARRRGLEVAAELFADRAYHSDGRLVPRHVPGSVVTDSSEAARRAVTLATEHRIETVEGGSIELEGSSICVHGDTPGAQNVARSVRAALAEAGVVLAPFVS